MGMCIDLQLAKTKLVFINCLNWVIMIMCVPKHISTIISPILIRNNYLQATRLHC